MPGENSLSSVGHVVVLMLENRSFDHMLGFLYSDSGNVSPAGQPYEGLTGTESNPASSGPPFAVFKIEPGTPNAYYMPGADPGEGYMATNDQLFGSDTAPASPSPPPSNDGFVKDFAYTLGWQAREGWSILPGTTAQDINAAFDEAAGGELRGILAVSHEELVSSDMLGNPHSSIVDAPLTLMLGGEWAKVVSWYDNEWGFSCRMVDLTAYMANQL
jgi:hypothetical protein